MLKIKIASVLVASTLLLGGCASKSPVNINDASKDNSNKISQEVAKTNENPQQPSENNTQVQQAIQTPQEETKKAEAQTQNKTTTNNTQNTTTTQKSVNQNTTQSSNNVQASTYNKSTQTAPNVVSQNGVEYLAAVEDEVLRLCNVERNKAGLSPLVMASNVREAARFKAQEMLTKNYFDHNSPYSGSPFDLMRNRGIQFGYAGENIQMSEGKDKAQITAQYLVTNWMNSPGHRANILNGNFKKMGIGVAFSANGNKAYESQMFTD